MTDYKRISERNYYLRVISELNKRIALYEGPKSIPIVPYHYHCYVVLRKGNEFKIKVLKWKPHYRVGYINSYGWIVMMILEQQALFTYDYVYSHNSHSFSAEKKTD